MEPCPSRDAVPVPEADRVTGMEMVSRTIKGIPMTTDFAAATTTETAHTMQCMEVWGGNTAVDNGVIMPGLDAWVYARPHGAAATDRRGELASEGGVASGGGDVHYVSSCATGRITRLLVADIAGHGEPVSDVAIALRTLMRRYVNYLDQSKFVARVNREFLRITQSGGFATAVAATYWAPTSVLLVCNAGHPRPLWYRAKRKQWLFLEPLAPDDRDESQDLRNLPLGIVESTNFRQFGMRLNKDDLVIFYTDSLIESADPRTRKHLGERGLLELAATLDPGDPPAMRDELLARVDAYRGGSPSRDDVTVLIFRHNGTKPRMTLMDRVRANWRFLTLIARRLARGRSEPIPWPEFGLATWGGAMIDRLNHRWGGPE